MRVFVCSPLRGHVQANQRFAAKLCRQVALWGHSPYASHLLCPTFLEDDNELERRMGMDVGLDFLAVCNELWWAVPVGFGKPSSGMEGEIKAAEYLRIQVRPFPTAEEVERGTPIFRPLPAQE